VATTNNASRLERELAAGNREALQTLQALEGRYKNAAEALARCGIKGRDICRMHNDVFNGDIERTASFLARFIGVHEGYGNSSDSLRRFRGLATDKDTNAFDVLTFAVIAQMCTIDSEIGGAIMLSKRPPGYIFRLYRSKGQNLEETAADLMEWYFPFKESIDAWKAEIAKAKEAAKALELAGQLHAAIEKHGSIDKVYAEWERKLDEDIGLNRNMLYMLVREPDLAVMNNEAMGRYKMLSHSKLEESPGSLSIASQYANIAERWKEAAKEAVKQGKLLGACNAHVEAGAILQKARDYVGAVAELELARAELAPLIEQEAVEAEKLSMLKISNEISSRIVQGKASAGMSLKRTLSAIADKPHQIKQNETNLLKTVDLLRPWGAARTGTLENGRPEP
jgi:hypothetical protein